MRRLAIRFGCFGVALAAIIGFIKSAALKNHGGANANLAPHFTRFATWTDAVGLGHDRLELLVFLAASVADVFVSWHGGCQININANCARWQRAKSRGWLNSYFRGAQNGISNAISILQFHTDGAGVNTINGFLHDGFVLARFKRVAKIGFNLFNAHARQ